MNIDKYIENACQTSNGYCYKSQETFDNNFDGVCYIGEYDLEELENMQSEGIDLTDEEIIEKYGYSHNSIRQIILEYMQQYNSKYRLEELVESGLDCIVFDIVNWQCPETFLYEAEFQYEYFPIDCNGCYLEEGDEVYLDKDFDGYPASAKLVWTITEARPEKCKITSKIGEVEVSPQELELIDK